MSQKIFEKALEKYDSAVHFVEKMSAVVEAFLPDFDRDTAHALFDIILQYTLLRVALADGKFLPIEGAFIDRITSRTDIINLMEDVPEEVTWQWLGEHEPLAHIEKIIDALDEVAKTHMNYFAQVFAILDSSTEGDELQTLCDYIFEIATCFGCIDGEGTPAEAGALMKTINDCLVEPWMKTYEKYKKVSAN